MWRLAVSSFVSAVPVVPVVPVSSSDVNVIGKIVLSDSEGENVHRRLFLSKKRHAPFVESQEEMNISGTLEKTPPVPRKKLRGIEYGGEHWWSAQDRAVAEKQKLYLDRRESLKVDVG